MPETIDQAFVNQYQNNIRILAQQRTSRLESTTIPPVQMIGENLYWERLAATEYVELASRHQDTPNIEPGHSRRKSTAAPKVWATLLDTQDQVRMLVDPKNYYNQAAKSALLRGKDRVIIAALEGYAYEGKTGSTAVALPDAQKIATGSVGLTIEKLQAAKELLDEAEVDEEAERYFVCAAHQIDTDLLGETEVISDNYNIRALINGTVEKFMGFRFIRTQLLTLSSTTRYCYAYAKGAVGFGLINDIQSRIDQRIDKNYAWQVWNMIDMGATRVEDEMVVQVACTET